MFQKKLSVLDVFRLKKLGLLPDWMWDSWSWNAKGKPRYRMDFTQNNRRRYRTAIYIMMVLLFYYFTSDSVHERGVRIPCILLFTVFMGFYCYDVVKFILWGRAVSKLKEMIEDDLYPFICRDNVHYFKSSAEVRLILRAMSCLDSQKANPGFPAVKRFFKPCHKVFLDFGLVNPKYDAYFAQAEYRISKRWAT